MAQIYVEDGYYDAGYAETILSGISVNWLTRVITIFKDDLTLVQSTPTEIRDLDLGWLKAQISLVLATEEGMANPDIMKHNTTVTLGGLTYARIIEIINGYTITFEAGATPWAVNITGGNSNVADVSNVNHVSVRPQNSAGNTSSVDIEYSSYNGAVHYSTTNPAASAGTTHPTGTPRQPVNNIPDALFIAGYRGFEKLDFDVAVTLSTTDFPAFVNGKIKGHSHIGSTVTLDGVYFTNTTFDECRVIGSFGDGSTVSFRSCIINGLGGCIYDAHDTTLSGTITFATGTGRSYFGECTTGDIDGAETVLDFAGSNQHLVMQNLSGKVRLMNLTDDTLIHTINMAAGKIIIDSSCTGGKIHTRGSGYVQDLSTGTFIVDNDLLESSTLDLIRKELMNKAVMNADKTLATIYEDDGITVSHQVIISEDGLTRTPI